MIEVRMEPNSSSFYASRCDVCGRSYHLGQFVNAGSKEHGIDVCHACIRSGDIEARLRQSLDAAEAEVTRLVGLLDRLKVPTWAEAEAAAEEARTAFEAEMIAACAAAEAERAKATASEMA